MIHHTRNHNSLPLKHISTMIEYSERLKAAMDERSVSVSLLGRRHGVAISR
jgi:hypothetical protein